MAATELENSQDFDVVMETSLPVIPSGASVEVGERSLILAPGSAETGTRMSLVKLSSELESYMRSAVSNQADQVRPGIVDFFLYLEPEKATILRRDIHLGLTEERGRAPRVSVSTKSDGTI